jgi:hypothetical protein
MIAFFKTRVGVLSAVGFLVMMAFAVRHVSLARQKRETRRPQPSVTSAAKAPAAAPVAAPAPSGRAGSPEAPHGLAENVAYLAKSYALDHQAREDRDALGVPITRRQTSRTDSAAPIVTDDANPSGGSLVRASLRFQGHPASAKNAPLTSFPMPAATPSGATPNATPSATPTVPRAERPKTKRFNPYGSVVKCELVFTLDSANEETPLIGLVMEPVYNNGALVIPAGAELHGVARPDRLRDRIVSGSDWVLIFPRERGRPNGRQLNVKGVALDRVEPDANGMTWGLTDGAYGLEGKIIRTMGEQELKRFIATFLAAGTESLQQRQTGGRDRDTVRSTPQNAVLQGLAANFAQAAADITAEIEAHGVFLRVPAGHQFYFYPMQLIDADLADISADVATVK